MAWIKLRQEHPHSGTAFWSAEEREARRARWKFFHSWKCLLDPSQYLQLVGIWYCFILNRFTWVTRGWKRSNEGRTNTHLPFQHILSKSKDNTGDLHTKFTLKVSLFFPKCSWCFLGEDNGGEFLSPPSPAIFQQKTVTPNWFYFHWGTFLCICKFS